MSSKLKKELQLLVKDEVISSEISDRIAIYYDQRKSNKPNILLAVFGIFGALLVGSGIILILGHNWDDLSRVVKTIIAFIPLLIGQLIAGFSILKNKSRVWKESSGTFLFFAIGISIALVSQIYNLDGDLGSFMITWVVLALPLVYLLRSHAVTLLVILFSSYYAMEQGVWSYRNRETPWMYLVFMLAILPHYWLLLKKYTSSHAAVIFNWIIPMSIGICLLTFFQDVEEYGWLIYIMLFGMYYNIGKLKIFKGLSTFRNGFLFTGSLGTIVILLIFTFRWIWEELFYKEWLYAFDSQEFYVSLFLGVITMLILVYNIVKNGVRSINLFQFSFLVFGLVFFLLPEVETLPTIIINILVLLLGITAIKKGADAQSFGILNYGLLIVSILICCRFFDINMSFVIRGVLFIAVGVGLFITNYLMLKTQKKKSNSLKN